MIDLLIGFGYFCLGYFIVLNGLYLSFTLLAWKELGAHGRRRRYAAVDEAFASPLTPAISVIVPAYNEELVIVESVYSILGLRYPTHEVIVVNDGSTDGTLAALDAAFDLTPVRMAVRPGLATALVRRIYMSRRHSNLWVIDKENGGKPDAMNAGLNVTRNPYICAVDADAVLEEDALLRVAMPMLEDPGHVAATGGIVRIVNGCVVDRGRVTDIRLPTSRLATLQVLEYLRAFLIGRVGWSRLNSLLIISGAFGVFDRRLVEAVGGWSVTTVGEDIELVVRLHRYLRERDEDYRIAFIPDPVCWTEVPEDLGTLELQRRRWQRGLGQTLWRHRRVFGNPRYGALGMLAFPYFLFVELLGPVVQTLTIPVVIAWWLGGGLAFRFSLAFLVVTVLLGVLLSLLALALEEVYFGRHSRPRDVARLAAYSLLENLGYRQLHDFWRVLGLGDFLRRKGEWGEQVRRGFNRPLED